MTTNRIKYRLPDVHEPTPEEVERAMRRCERLRAQACRDVARAVARSLTRAFRAGAPGHRTASEAPAV